MLLAQSPVRQGSGRAESEVHGALDKPRPFKRNTSKFPAPETTVFAYRKRPSRRRRPRDRSPDGEGTCPASTQHPTSRPRPARRPNGIYCASRHQRGRGVGPLDRASPCPLRAKLRARSPSLYPPSGVIRAGALRGPGPVGAKARPGRMEGGKAPDGPRRVEPNTAAFKRC